MRSLFCCYKQHVFFLPQTIHGIGFKYFNMLFEMHGLTYKFKSPGVRVGMVLDHLVEAHGWSANDVQLVKDRLPKTLKPVPPKPQLRNGFSQDMFIILMIEKTKTPRKNENQAKQRRLPRSQNWSQS